MGKKKLKTEGGKKRATQNWRILQHPLLDYLNRIEFEKQIHSFVRKTCKIDVGLIGKTGFERIEAGLDKSEVFKLPKCT